MELLKIEYVKFVKVSGIETETAWAPVNAANLHLAHGARWNWLGGTNPPKKREIGKPKEKATKKESGPVTHSRVRDHLSLALEHCATEGDE